MKCAVLLIALAVVSSAATGPSVLSFGPASTHSSGVFSVSLVFDAPITGLSVGDFTTDLRDVNPSIKPSEDIRVYLERFSPVNDTSYTVAVDVRAPSGLDFLAMVVVVLRLEAGAVRSMQGVANEVACEASMIFDNIVPASSLIPTGGLHSNLATRELVLAFHEEVVLMTLDALEVEVTQGDLTFARSALTLVATNTTAGLYLLTIPNLANEGTLQIHLPSGATTDLAANPTMGATISIIRDVTPVSVSVTSVQGNLITDTLFDVRINFSEPVLGFGNDDVVMLTIGRGAAARSEVAKVSSSCDYGLQWSLEVSSLETFSTAASPRESFVLTVQLQITPGSLTDLAGNESPLDEDEGRLLQVTADFRARRAALIANGDGSQPSGSGVDVALIVSIVAAVLLIVLCVVGYWLTMVWWRKREARHAERAFREYGLLVFDQYPGDKGSNGGLKYNDIYQYGLQNGYGKKRSREGAKRLMAAADANKDGILSADEFINWLKRVVLKGGKIVTKDSVRELKIQFVLE